MLLVSFLGEVSDSVPRLNLFYPFHFGSMVSLEGAKIYLSQTLSAECTDDWTEDKVWDEALVYEVVTDLEDAFEDHSG